MVNGLGVDRRANGGREHVARVPPSSSGGESFLPLSVSMLAQGINGKLRHRDRATGSFGLRFVPYEADTNPTLKTPGYPEFHGVEINVLPSEGACLTLP